jgi:hypothetical protein
MGNGGIINGTPTPDHITMVLPLFTLNTAGVGVPFIIPLLPTSSVEGSHERGQSGSIPGATNAQFQFNHQEDYSINAYSL